MTMTQFRDENRKLRRQLRATKDALRESEETLRWVERHLKARAARQEGRP